MLDLGLKIKSIEIDIEAMSKIYNINGSCELERLREMRENALKIRKLLSELETPALTKTPINDKVVFKNLLINIVNDDRFIAKKVGNEFYVLSKYLSELLKLKNIDKRKFYQFFKDEKVITTETTSISCRVGGTTHRCSVIDVEKLKSLEVV